MATRQIRFYEIVSAQQERFPNDLPFDELRDEVRALDDADAYVTLNRMEILGSTYDPPKGPGKKRRVPLLALDRITRDVHLRIERRRNYRPLVLADDETLAEPTFYSVFPRNVLGVMRNSGAAPGPASFRDYVNRLALLGQDVNVVPLSDANLVRALTDVESLTRFTFAVGPDVAADAFGQSELVSGAIRAVRQELGAVTVEVSVKIDLARSGEASERALADVRQVVMGDSRGFLSKAQMAYRSIEDGRAETYNFLNEAVALPVEVELNAATGQPTEPSASEAMAVGYDELYDDIASALNSVG